MVVQNNGKEMYEKKKCAARAKLFFCYLDLIGPFIREKIKAAA